MSDPISFAVKQAANAKVILLIHGFSGESHATFGMLPAFLAGDPGLAEWDIFCFGYPSKLAPDITGIWSSDPDLITLSGYLASKLADGSFDQYSEIALIAHSMGGLIVQRALLDGGFIDKVKHVLLFGTPSNGLNKARLLQLFKKQTRDMSAGGAFISQLRLDWNNRFSSHLPFSFSVVAGLRDEFVPTSSSVEIFDSKYRRYVQGNHLEMVKPRSLADDVTLLVKKELSSNRVNERVASDHGVAATAQKLNSEEKLSTSALANLALALEMTGEQDRAIAILEENYEGDTELTGILAGRFKRRWLADPVEKEDEGRRAHDLYKEAFNKAAAANDHPQAFYNGINAAFMELALYHNRYDARVAAVKVLEHCRQARRDKWRLATEGEANLYLGEFKFALDCYEAALHYSPDSREIDSMYKQAVWVSRLLQNLEVERAIQQLFNPYITQ